MTTYRDFLREVEMVKLKQGRDGFRLVGDVTTYNDGRRALGLLVPDLKLSVDEWEAERAPEPSAGVSVPRTSLPVVFTNK